MTNTYRYTKIIVTLGPTTEAKTTLVLPWGVEPFKMQFSDDPETTISNALATLKQNSWCLPGTWLVVITNALASSKVIDTLQLRQIE